MKRFPRVLAVTALLVLLFSMVPATETLAETAKTYYDLSIRTDEEKAASLMTVTAGSTKMYNESNEVICTLKRNEKVYFLWMSGDYCYVIRDKASKEGNLGGYVALSDLQFENFDLIMDSLKDDEIKKFAVRVTGDYVNMRAGIAGTKQHKEIINWDSGLRKGETVYAYQTKNNWYKVVRKKKVGGVHQVGWVWGDFIDNDGPSIWRDRYVGGVPATAKPTGASSSLSRTFQAQIAVDHANLRTNEKGPVLGQYPKGTIVTVYYYGELSDGFVHVRINGTEGYMSSKLLKKID